MADVVSSTLMMQRVWIAYSKWWSVSIWCNAITDVRKCNVICGLV